MGDASEFLPPEAPAMASSAPIAPEMIFACRPLSRAAASNSRSVSRVGQRANSDEIEIAACSQGSWTVLTQAFVTGNFNDDVGTMGQQLGERRKRSAGCLRAAGREVSRTTAPTSSNVVVISRAPGQGCRRLLQARSSLPEVAPLRSFHPPLIDFLGSRTSHSSAATCMW